MILFIAFRIHLTEDMQWLRMGACLMSDETTTVSMIQSGRIKIAIFITCHR